jgi:1,3-beta-glucanosyltransferase GAS1
MYEALTCVPSSEVNNNNVGALFGLVCGLGQDTCAGIAANATSGTYGAYGMCNPQQQIGWALNAYYEQQSASGNGASACDFSGSATMQSAVYPTGTCAELVSQAGGQGTGTVTSAPTGTVSATSGGSTSHGAAAPGISTMASLNIGVAQIAVYMLFAVGTGTGMILL